MCALPDGHSQLIGLAQSLPDAVSVHKLLLSVVDDRGRGCGGGGGGCGGGG